MDMDNIDVINNWDKWKSTLSKAVNAGQAVGLSQETIQKLGVKVGNFLSSSVDPENREQRVLKELWKAGDDRDRISLTRMIVRMVQNDL